MEPSSDGPSCSKKPAKKKSNSLPLGLASPVPQSQSEDDVASSSISAHFPPEQELRKLDTDSRPVTSFNADYNTQCEGPGKLDTGFSILETIGGMAAEQHEPEKWIDARSELSPVHTPVAPALSLSLSRLSTTTNVNSDNNVVRSNHELDSTDNHNEEEVIAQESINVTETLTPVHSEPEVKCDPASDEVASSSRIVPQKKKSSGHTDLGKLYPELRQKLGIQLLMANLGRPMSLRMLSEEDSVSEQSEDDVQVYRMEKKPERIEVKQEELWFHRPDWTEYPNLLPQARNRKEDAEHLLLIVDESNEAEDSSDAELFMMHHRVLRSNQAALNTIIADEETMQEVFLTPIGFEYSDIVLERKFFISWKVAQLYQKSKKDIVKTTIPLTGTKYFKRPLPLRIRIWRRFKHFFRFSWCSRRMSVLDEEIIRQSSIDAFHNEIFAIEVRGLFSGKDRLIYRRENVYGHPISTDNLLRGDENKLKRRK